MGPLGPQEMIVIFVLALLLFGPKKLPELGKNLAKAIGEFKRASSELKDTWHREMANIERETVDIKKEAEAVAQTTSEYTSYDSSYNYDSSYDYNYGYNGGTDGSSSAETEVSASATEGADNAAPAAVEEASTTGSTTAADASQPAAPAKALPADAGAGI